MDGRTTTIAVAAFMVAAGLTPTVQAPAPSAAAIARWEARQPPGKVRPGSLSQDDMACLALNVYWESRGEPEEGRLAVAHVTLNRLEAKSFPETVCGVIRQGGPLGPCQFEWYCDGKPDTPLEAEAWRDAQRIARRAVAEHRRDPTRGALYFHHISLRPVWARARLNTQVIGRHMFFSLQGGELGERQLAQAVDPRAETRLQ